MPTNKITELPVLTPFTEELPDYVLADLKGWHYKIRVADIQNRVAIEELSKLRKKLNKKIKTSKVVWCVDGPHSREAGLYKEILMYIDNRLAFLEKMA